MVVCKFFLQGTCKFGDFCKFEHQLNDNFNAYQASNSILRQSQFGNAQQQPKPATNPSNVDTNTLVKSVVNDMITTEKGGQWLLSCYGPFKEKPGFPGFEDHSFEEIRLGYYEAVKNGTVEQYKQQIQMLLQQAAMRVKSLQTPSPDVVNLLKNIYHTPVPQGTNTATKTGFGNVTSIAQPSQNIFGQPSQPQKQYSGTTNSIFGGTATPNQTFGGQVRNNSIFGNTQMQPQSNNANIFQQANSVFGAQSNNSVFGQPTTSQANTGSIFGGGQSVSNSIFGGQQTGNIFGAQQKVSPSFGSPPQIPSGGTGIFNSTFNQNPQNIFGTTPNMTNQAFAAPIQQNVPQTQSVNIFQMQSNQPQVEVAKFNQQQPSLFNQAIMGNSVFNQQPQQLNSPFMQPTSGVVDVKNYSNSIFGSNQSNAPTGSSIFGHVQDVDKTVYSTLEELTEDEIKWFESEDLDVSRIPEKPPTFEMCFKT